jgi:hypothetical protein
MGDKFIWIAVSAVYGLVSSLVYVWLCYRRKARHLLLRFGVMWLLYSIVAVALCRVLWVIFSD